MDFLYPMSNDNQITQVKSNIRYISENEEILFCLSDVLREIESSSDISKTAISLEEVFGKGTVTKRPLKTAGGNQDMWVIPESGLTYLVANSRTEAGRKLNIKIHSEVLPSIRKNGMYATEITIDKMLSDPDFAIGLLTKLKEEKGLRLKAEKEKSILVHANKLYTSTELAKECGLRSAIELNKLLHEKGIQFKQNGTWVLYSNYSTRAWTSIKQTVLDTGKIVYDRMWTGVGREYIVNLIQRA